ncbi:hypothetical protein F4814DRAFT_399137 [Daldinia grandis]|nr:hypothetical protein F4814DRAFT_399137 [Daldinia grandis]
MPQLPVLVSDLSRKSSPWPQENRQQLAPPSLARPPKAAKSARPTLRRLPVPTRRPRPPERLFLSSGTIMTKTKKIPMPRSKPISRLRKQKKRRMRMLWCNRVIAGNNVFIS